jgi:hypothetical protein
MDSGWQGLMALPGPTDINLPVPEHTMFTPAELRWTMHAYQPLLARFGYDKLYQLWLSALVDTTSPPSVAFADRLRGVYEETRGTGSWSDDWSPYAPTPD